MNLSGPKFQLGIVAIFLFFAARQVPATGTVSAAESTKPAFCRAPEYRQFDFWIGDWDAFDVTNPTTKVARTRVDLILDGCVLHEDYEGADGHKGQSFSIYDTSRSIWHQSWVTNRGEMLVIEGGLQAGEMVLSGVNHTADGKERHVRGSWKPVNGGVRETAVTSTDSGRTWKPWFDLIFRAAAASAASPRTTDEAMVVALDTQYQAAVKGNDAATMDHILADDFALVTGSGNTYTKADLLAEARSGRVHYERQDDTDQTVRVWGDTAVITANRMEICIWPVFLAVSKARRVTKPQLLAIISTQSNLTLR